MGLNCVQNREILGGENVEEMMEKQGHSSMYIDKQVLRGEVGIQQATYLPRFTIRQSNLQRLLRAKTFCPSVGWSVGPSVGMS